MNKKLPYETPKDFSPITILGTAPNVLVAHPSLPARTVKDLIALAKGKPGQLNYPRGLSERRGRFETSACAFEE